MAYNEPAYTGELQDITAIDVSALGRCERCELPATEPMRIETVRGSTIFCLCEKHLNDFREHVWKFLKPAS